MRAALLTTSLGVAALLFVHPAIARPLEEAASIAPMTVEIALPATDLLETPEPALAATALPILQASAVPVAESVARVRTKGDPLEGLNRSLFRVHTRLDRAVYRPVAMATRKVVPKPFRDGIRNFFRNLREPFVFLNDVLQLRFRRAGESIARFGVNTVLGIGGLFDVAGKDGLKAHNNGFGGTLARYGVGPGPYLFLPLVGPTTLRDLLGGQAEGLVLPLAVGKPFDRIDYNVGKTVFLGIDQRIERDAEYSALLSGAADPYATLRSAFLQNRAAEVAELKGKPGATGPDLLDTPLDDPTGATTEPAQPEPTPEPDPAPEPVPPKTSDARTDLYGSCYA